MRTEARPRRAVSAMALRCLKVAFRSSHSRNAYVLRFVGDRFGPVRRPRAPRGGQP